MPSVKTRALIAASGMLLAATATPAAAVTTIDTTAPFTTNIFPFGEAPRTTAYGQTFTVGADNVLNSFSLYLDDEPIVGPVEFTAYVFAWNGTMATGPALYTSSLQSFAGSPINSPVEFAFNTGNLALTTGAQYVAFLFASSGHSAQMPFSGISGSDAYGGGSFVFYNANAFSDLTSNAWDGATTFSPTDVWFKATFNGVGGAVPEPGTWALMLLGFGGIGLALRRDRKRTALA